MNTSARRAFTHLGAALLAVAGMSAAAAAPGEAQPSGPGEPPDQAQSSPAEGATVLPENVSDQKLQQFAEAAAEVQAIQQDYATKAQSLQKTTEEKIVSSVQDAGMTVAEFTAIVERIQTDPSLARRLDGLQSQSQSQ